MSAKNSAEADPASQIMPLYFSEFASPAIFM